MSRVVSKLEEDEMKPARRECDAKMRAKNRRYEAKVAAAAAAAADPTNDYKRTVSDAADAAFTVAIYEDEAANDAYAAAELRLSPAAVAATAELVAKAKAARAAKAAARVAKAAKAAKAKAAKAKAAKAAADAA